MWAETVKIISELAVPTLAIIGYVWAIRSSQVHTKDKEVEYDRRLDRLERIMLNGGKGLENRVSVLEALCEERHGRTIHANQ